MLKETEELIGIFGENFCDDDEYIEKSITLIVEYYMKNGRHSYSTISKIINSKLDQGEDSIIYILFNIKEFMILIKSKKYEEQISKISSKKYCLEDIVQKLEKLYDHISLEETRIKYNYKMVNNSNTMIENNVMNQFNTTIIEFQNKLDEIAYRQGKVEPASIVILSYNNRKLTQQCIESIRETTPESAREIVIVDNNSQDDSVAYLRQQDDIVLVENDFNAGFPGGCNIGIKASKKENDIFLLNNDTILCANSLYTLRMGLYEKDNYGSAGSVTNNCANLQSVFKSDSIDELKEFGLKNNIVNKRNEIKLMLVAFAVLIKRHVLEKVGYLDERFFPGNFEDDDISLRILKENYQNVLVYNSFIIHLGTVSFQKVDYSGILKKNYDKLVEKYNFNEDHSFFCFTHSESNVAFYSNRIKEIEKENGKIRLDADRRSLYILNLNFMA